MSSSGFLSQSRSETVFFFLLCCGACFGVYWPALHGAFVSDDVFYVVGLANNYEFDWSFVELALDPSSDLKHQNMNYAPLYLLVSRLESAIFGAKTLGYHVVNVIFHAVNATLVVALLRTERVEMRWALLGGAFFAFHPANVEAVAWISQLRSILALGFGLAAILALRRRPGASAVLFAVGLLFKVSASFALPVALALYWCTKRDSGREPISLAWLGVWAGVFALYAYPQFISFYMSGRARTSVYADWVEQLRSVAAIGARYLYMAVTSLGLSAFHQPKPAQSWLNSWWLASLPLAGVLFWRIVRGLSRRKEEAAYWIGAAAAWAPISQIFPFYFAIGDRYLYFILPGLIVATLLWWQELRASLPSKWGEARSRALERALQGALVLLIALFAVHSNWRAELWLHEDQLRLESAVKYPHGGLAHWVRGVIALDRGNIELAVKEFRGVLDTNYYRYIDMFSAPVMARYEGHPAIVRLRHRVARKTIKDFEQSGMTTQHQLRSVANAYAYLGEYDLAIARLEQALDHGGPHYEAIRGDLERLWDAKRAIAARATREGSP